MGSMKAGMVGGEGAIQCSTNCDTGRTAVGSAAVGVAATMGVYIYIYVSRGKMER